MPLIEKNIGKRVERLRASKNAMIDSNEQYLDKERLANILSITVQQYDERVKGNTPFSVRSLSKIAKMYQTDVNYILFGGIK